MTSDMPPPPGRDDSQQPPSSYPWQPTPPSNAGYGDGGVPQYPQGSDSPVAAAQQPPSITRAVMLMRVGAVLSGLSLVVALLSRSSMRDSIRTALVDGEETFTQDDVIAIYNFTLATIIFVTVLSVVLWLGMASANGKGRKWARIVSTALGALNVTFFLTTLERGRSTTVNAAISVISVLLAVAILVLLWRRESTDYYNARSRPAYT